MKAEFLKSSTWFFGVAPAHTCGGPTPPWLSISQVALKRLSVSLKQRNSSPRRQGIFKRYGRTCCLHTMLSGLADVRDKCQYLGLQKAWSIRRNRSTSKCYRASSSSLWHSSMTFKDWIRMQSEVLRLQISMFLLYASHSGRSCSHVVLEPLVQALSESLFQRKSTQSAIKCLILCIHLSTCAAWKIFWPYGRRSSASMSAPWVAATGKIYRIL